MKEAVPNPHLRRAAVALDVGRYRDAIEEAKLAIGLEPNNSRAYGFLARGYLGLERLTDAERALRAGLAQAPDSEWLHRLLGIALRPTRLNDALQAIDEALRLSPKEPLGHLVKGNVLRDLGRPATAEHHYLEALRLDPQLAEAYRNLGLLALKEKKWLSAETHFRDSLRLNPRDAVSLNNLGVALNGQRKWDDARLMFQSAVKINPQLAEAKRNLHANLARTMKAPLAGAITSLVQGSRISST